MFFVENYFKHLLMAIKFDFQFLTIFQVFFSDLFSFIFDKLALSP